MTTEHQYFDRKLLLATAALLAAVVLLGNAGAPLPLLVLYAALIVVAILLPFRPVSNVLTLRAIGLTSILVGLWLYAWELGTRIELIGFVVVGAIAIVFPARRLRDL